MIVSLVGLPGCGKTTVGRQLARRLQLPFADSDRLIEVRLGCSIREFFESEGESRFREIESEVIGGLTQGPPCVLSTGGGAILSKANREYLKSGGQVVYLRSTPDQLFRRLRHDSTRPLLQVDDPLARMRELYAERDPLYREVASFVMEIGRPSVATLVNMIVMQLKLAGVLPDQ